MNVRIVLSSPDTGSADEHDLDQDTQPGVTKMLHKSDAGGDIRRLITIFNMRAETHRSFPNIRVVALADDREQRMLWQEK